MLASVAKRQYCIVLITRRLSRIQFSPKPIYISGADFFYLASDSDSPQSHTNDTYYLS